MNLKHTAILAAVLAVPVCAAWYRPGPTWTDRPLARNVEVVTAGKASSSSSTPAPDSPRTTVESSGSTDAPSAAAPTAVDAAASFVSDHAKDLWGVDAEQFLPIGPWQDETHVPPADDRSGHE